MQFFPQILSCFSLDVSLKSEYSYSVVSFLPNKFIVLRQVCLVFPKILNILKQQLKTRRLLLFKAANPVRVPMSSPLNALMGIGERQKFPPKHMDNTNPQ